MGYETDYAEIVREILGEGEERVTRNGNTLALFGVTLDVDISWEFPLLRGRKLFYKPVLGELATMFKGPKNIQDFKENGCNYWDAWGTENGSLNLDYGNAWIDFNGVNQLEELVKGIKKDPTGRRHIVTGWRPDRLKELSLPCCHLLYQFYVREGKYIDMIWYQRSADWMVGVPSDVILAAAWLIVLGNEVNLRPGRVKLVFGDTHIYENHIPNALKYLRQRAALGVSWHIGSTLPSFSDIRNIEYNLVNTESIGVKMRSFEPENLEILNYESQCMPAIKFELNV